MNSTFHTAFTKEIDDAKLAVREVLSQLPPGAGEKGTWVGFVACHQEFIDSGVVAALCEALGFPVIGLTTVISALRDAADTFQLSLMAACFDEARVTIASAPLTADGYRDSLTALWGELTGDTGEKPALILSAQPPVSDIGHDAVVEELNRLSGNTPLFGGVAINYVGADVANAHTLLSGTAYSDRIVALAVFGELEAEFTCHSFPETNIVDRDALLTRADGNIIYEINNIPAQDYLRQSGMLTEDNLNLAHSLPVIVNPHDGTGTEARNIYECGADGSVICTCRLKTGSTISFGSMELGDVVKTAGESAALVKKECKAVLFISCAVRYLTLGWQEYAETDRIAELVPEGVPYLFAYTFGEICPLVIPDGTLRTKLLNNSLVACRIY